MYEKRRDWEKLIQLSVREAEQLPVGGERAQKYKQIALLATDKVKKPEVCIDLWAGRARQRPRGRGRAERALAALRAFARVREARRRARPARRGDVRHGCQDRAAEQARSGRGRSPQGRRARGRRVPHAAHRCSRTIGARKSSSRSATSRSGAGTISRCSTPRAASGTSSSACSRATRRAPRTQQQRIGMLMKIAELWLTQKGKARSRRARLREGAERSTRTTSPPPSA